MRAPRCLGSAAMVSSVSAAACEQETIDHRLVVPGDVADRRGQGEDHVVILHGQQIGLAGLQPAPGRTGLTLGAMPVATGVVGDLGVVTGRALQHMTAQRRAAAAFDGRHDLELAEAEVSGLCTTPRRPVGAEDIRDLQGGGGMPAVLGGRSQRLQWADHLAQELRWPPGL